MTPEKKQSEAPSSALSARKRRAFTAVIILFPILLIVLSELLLRYFQYGGNLALVTTKRQGGKEYYCINRSVARRYFAHAGTVIPEPADDVFEIRKASNTKRIFCLGESTMAGFPYEFQATAPGFLRDRLDVLLPQFNIEVINVGLSAVGSYVVKDFVDEIVNYEPDLFIIYVGHNEFYGAYGIGSTVAIKGGSWLTRFTLSLLKFKTFLVLRDGYALLQSRLTTETQRGDATLMEQMVGSQSIPYRSEPYQKAREVYRENIESIIETAQSHRIPIMFSTLVSNIRTQPPFESVFKPDLAEAQRRQWSVYVASGDSAVAAGNYERAKLTYEAAARVDTLNAEPYFKLGRSFLKLGDYDGARAAFIRAKDLDALRFRVTEEFQQDLLDICRSHHVPVARVDSSFDVNSPNGLVGSELILEHLHPNIDGYFLMAKTFCSASAQNNLLGDSHDWHWELDKSDSAYLDLSTVSEFDRLAGKVKVDLLTHKWPFVKEVNDYQFKPGSAEEAIVYNYIQKKTAWSDARYDLAQFYASSKKFELARRECLAVAKVIPFSYQPLLRIADYFRNEGKQQEAQAAYRHCYEVEDNPFARMKLAIIFLEEDNPSEAAGQISTAFALEENGPYKLPAAAAASGRYLLGVAFAQMGKVSEARENLQRALVIEPTFEDARSLLQQLSR
jgi:tetratricopeptide (TPR) repeat protein